MGLSSAARKKVIGCLLLACWLAACDPAGGNSTGGLFVTSVPSGATVSVDARVRGQTPLTVRDLEPGAHDVLLQLDDHEDTRLTATIRARQIVQLSGSLQPARRPVGHRFAFVSNRDGAFDIWTADDSGGDLSRWTSGRWDHAPLLAQVSGTGSYFALNFEDVRGLRTWMVAAPRPEYLLNGEPKMRSLSGDVFRILQWSPDGRSLLLKNLISQTIWIAGTNGTLTQVRIPDTPRGVLSAAFASESSSIVYADTERTYRIGLDGSGRQDLSDNGREGNTYLRFSYDGRRLAQVRIQTPNAYNAGELWLLNADGSGERRLTVGGALVFDPVWTHDGTRIIYVRRENSDDPSADADPVALISNLWVVDVQSQTHAPLTTFRGKRVRHPSIAADDRRLLFVSNQSGAEEVWAIDLAGGEPYPLTRDGAAASFPMWLW